MKIAKVLSAQNDCLSGNIIQVEVDISRGLHAFSIVGMADKAVAEAKDRIASAIKHSGYKSPKSRNEKVVISLAPAKLPKEGAGFDLAMAIGYLIAAQELAPMSSFDMTTALFVGELALDGNIRKVPGIISIAKSAKDGSIRHLFVPKEQGSEASLISGLTVYGVQTLREVILHLDGRQLLKPENSYFGMRNTADRSADIPLEQIDGQEQAKRALRVAIAGRHPIGLIGPPGTGKTMLARSALSMLPDLTEEEMIETLAIHSVGGTEATLLGRGPFRSPHHSASYASIIGGGAKQPIGEMTLAHNGILFLDEFPEFDRRVIEALRQPMEEKVIRIARAEQHRELPADCIIILAMNPCPCGYRGTDVKPCTCSQSMLRRYAEKISGPIIDRVDLWVQVERSSYVPPSRKKASAAPGKEADPAATERRSIWKIRKIQKSRKESGQSDSRIKNEALSMLIKEAARLAFSTRSFHRTLGVARTIADLDGSEWVEKEHVFEALQYRQPPFQ